MHTDAPTAPWQATGPARVGFGDGSIMQVAARSRLAGPLTNANANGTCRNRRRPRRGYRPISHNQKKPAGIDALLLSYLDDPGDCRRTTDFSAIAAAGFPNSHPTGPVQIGAPIHAIEPIQITGSTMNSRGNTGPALRRSVICDIGDVLIRTVKHEHHRALGRLTGMAWPEVAHQIARSGIEIELECGRISAPEFTTALREILSCPSLCEGDVRRCWAAVLGGPEGQTLAAAARLATSGQLVLASNTNEMHWPAVRRRLGRAGVRAPAWLSFEVGHAKPDRRFYSTLRAHGPPIFGPAIYIDDRPDNVQAASDVGFDGWVHLDPATTAAHMLRLCTEGLNEVAIG
jgi:FMN phosphatase YigB (HAD superfamily)